jgi:hypothetical protein
MIIHRAETLARSRAIEDRVLEAGDAEGVLFPHMPGLQVQHLATEWGRGGGRLYIKMLVTLSDGWKRTYAWRAERADPRGWAVKKMAG